MIWELKKAGLSVMEVVKKTGIPKTSVGRYYHFGETKIALSEAQIQAIEERRRKVLELNHAHKGISEIARILGCTPMVVNTDLWHLKKNPANNVIHRRQMQFEKVKEKAALPEPDKKIECPNCGGLGGYQVDADYGEDCLDCAGTGRKDSFYGNIVKEPVLPTRNMRIRNFHLLMKYLGITDWQQLLTWYRRYKTEEQNNLYFENRLGDGFIVKELNDKRKLKVRTQKTVIGNIKTGYELNGVTTLPWKRIFNKITPPQGRKSEQQIDDYTEEQIKILYSNCNPTYKALIAFLMSGPRIGGAYQRISSVDRLRYPEKERYLRIRDLTDPLEDLSYEERRDFLLKIPRYDETPLYQMNIYSEDLNRHGDPDYYTCWSTPEFYYLINLVLAKRQKDGELDLIDPELKNKPFDIEIWREKCPDSPVFRAEYGKYDVTSPVILSSAAMDKYLGKKRKNFIEPMKKRVKLFNGFRSYVQTVLEHNVKPSLTPNEVQWFMGRELPGMGEHYDKWGKLEQLTKFWNALEWLTVGEMKERFLNQKIEIKDEQIKQEKQERQRQADEMYGISAMTKQALQESQETRNLMHKFMSVLTPEEITKIQERISSSSSLPLESKKMLIDVTKATVKTEDNHTEGEEHT